MAAPITSFSGLIAVVTGGGTGMGRELTKQLVAEGCSVAICDVSTDNMDETVAEAAGVAVEGARVVSYLADVADEAAMDSFAAFVAAELGTAHINLLFNNAGIGGGGSLVNEVRAEWDRVFAICWGGVLNGVRSFLPMLLASERGHVINTSSVNGMWACLGPQGAHTAYSSAKFAVKGLTEALIVDFRVNAPHLTASVVMPGHIGTLIARNSMLEFGRDPKNLTEEQVIAVREQLANRGIDASGASDEDVRNMMALRVESFEQDAPTSSGAAATVILDAVKAGEWRVLIGADAVELDAMIRANPTEAYSEQFMYDLRAAGHFGGLIPE